MILEQMPDHQPEVTGFSQITKLFRLGYIQSQGLFHKDVLASAERFARQGIMLRRRCCDCNRRYFWVGQDLRPLHDLIAVALG